MTKKISIALLFIYLFSTTELNQLLKLPLLFQHFIEHKETNQQISFWSFLEMHYLAVNENAPDHDKDMKLPFKTHSIVSFFSVVLPEQGHFTFNAYAGFYPANSMKSIFSDFYYTAFQTSIWQPPKL